MRRGFALLVLALLPTACNRSDDGEGDKRGDKHSASATSLGAVALPTAAAPPVLSVRDVRTLARNATPLALPLLERALLPGGESARFAVFGLGTLCRREAARIEPLLLSTLANSVAQGTPLTAADAETLAWALASCATVSAEKTLTRWVNSPSETGSKELALAAAVALGHLVDLRGTLEEQTLTLLLDTAEHEKDGTYLYPLTRLSTLSGPLSARTLDVSGALVVKGKQGKRHAIFALGSAGSVASEPLFAIVTKSKYSDVDRAAAAQTLGRLGDSGQKALDRALEKLLEEPLPTSAKASGWLPLRAGLRSLVRARASKKLLQALSLVALSEGGSPEKNALRRRLIQLRCRAAELGFEGDPKSPALTACDPDTTTEKSVEGPLAQLRVLNRDRVDDAERRKLFFSFLDHPDPRVSTEALKFFASHKELTKARGRLIKALASGQEGVRTSALRVFAAHPELALTDEKEPATSEDVLREIGRIFSERKTKPTSEETLASAIEATGALRALSLKASVDEFCDGPLTSLYPAAEKALSLLGNPERHCPNPSAAPPANFRAERAGSTPMNPGFRLTIDSDVGELSLLFAGKDCEENSARLKRLFLAHAFDQTFVSATSEGYGVQFGDPDGDGFDDGAVPLTDERTPDYFSRGKFGLSGFARGSAFPHSFVALGDAFPLTGERVLLGSAEGPFELLLPGDKLRGFRVSELPSK